MGAIDEDESFLIKERVFEAQFFDSFQEILNFRAFLFGEALVIPFEFHIFLLLRSSILYTTLTQRRDAATNAHACSADLASLRQELIAAFAALR